jgi:hypothetical protein
LTAFCIACASPATKQACVKGRSLGDNASFKNARAMISGPMPQGSPGVIAMGGNVDINGFGSVQLEMNA